MGVLYLAWYLFAKGYIPQPTAEEVASQTAEAQPEDDEELALIIIMSEI